MENLVDRGLVKSIGVSNFSPEKIQEILKNARIHPAVNQVSRQTDLDTCASFVSACSSCQEWAVFSVCNYS